MANFKLLKTSHQAHKIRLKISGSGGQMVKNLPAMQETWVQSLGQEDPLEKGMATHSSIVAWRIPMDRGAWRAMVHGVAKSWIQLDNKYTQLRYPSFPLPYQ